MAGLLAIGTLAIGCHGLLDVSDPTLVRESDIANAAGANALRLNASSTFEGNSIGITRDIALFTDEFTMRVPQSFILANNRNAQLDLRNSAAIELLDPSASHMGALENALWQTSLAIPAVRAYTPDSLRGDFLAHLYAIRGYVILQMAEDLCPGFPVNDVVDNRTVYGGPLTTDSAVALAITQLDSAITYVHDSTRFATLARVAKGRALLDQGNYTAAAAAVTDVVTTSSYGSEIGNTLIMGRQFCPTCLLTALGNHEGGNGQSFASGDPRIPRILLGVLSPADTLYVTTKGTGPTDRLIFASGIEARLIQAEAALHNNQDWKAILDSIRTTVGLGALADPGTDSARASLIYGERAFWLFMTGRRLGDLRRLIKNYGRSQADVFPTGTWPGGSGDSYGTATSIPFNFADQQKYNPNITTGCTSR